MTNCEFRFTPDIFSNPGVFHTVIAGFFPDILREEINGGYIDFWLSENVLNVGYVNVENTIIRQRQFTPKKERGL